VVKDDEKMFNLQLCAQHYCLGMQVFFTCNMLLTHSFQTTNTLAYNTKMKPVGKLLKAKYKQRKCQEICQEILQFLAGNIATNDENRKSSFMKGEALALLREVLEDLIEFLAKA
jgi:hypothetical protein